MAPSHTADENPAAAAATMKAEQRQLSPREEEMQEIALQPMVAQPMSMLFLYFYFILLYFTLLWYIPLPSPFTPSVPFHPSLLPSNTYEAPKMKRPISTYIYIPAYLATPKLT